MFLLLLVNFVSGVRLELMYSPHRKYQIKPHTSPWFAAASAAAIFHRDHFFCLHQQNKSSESKVKFRQASNCCKRVLKAVKLAYGNKTKESITFQKDGSWNSSLYSTDERCCLLHMIKQNCLQKLLSES